MKPYGDNRNVLSRFVDDCEGVRAFYRNPKGFKRKPHPNRKRAHKKRARRLAREAIAQVRKECGF